MMNKTVLRILTLISGVFALGTMNYRSLGQVGTQKITLSSKESLSSEKLFMVDTSQSVTKRLVWDKDYLSQRFLGTTARGEALFLLDNVTNGKFFWFDRRTGKLLRSMPSAKFDLTYLRLSNDGRKIFTHDNVNVLPKGQFHMHDLLVVDAENLTLLKE